MSGKPSKWKQMIDEEWETPKFLRKGTNVTIDMTHEPKLTEREGKFGRRKLYVVWTLEYGNVLVTPTLITTLNPNVDKCQVTLECSTPKFLLPIFFALESLLLFIVTAVVVSLRNQLRNQNSTGLLLALTVCLSITSTAILLCSASTLLKARRLTNRR